MSEYNARVGGGGGVRLRAVRGRRGTKDIISRFMAWKTVNSGELNQPN